MTTSNINTGVSAPELQSALNRILAYRELIEREGHQSFFDYGERGAHTRRSEHMTMCNMLDDLCNALGRD
jgi:hypothetical protein